MKWKKLGLIFSADNNNEWLHTHAAAPIAEHITQDRFRIYFTARDKLNRGHGGFVEIDLNKPQNILSISKKPILVPGELGCFDDSGAVPGCILTVNNEKWMYYTGVNLGVTVPIRNSIGLAKWDSTEQMYKKMFYGPIVDRTKYAPNFCATPDVLYENNTFKMWLAACQRWVTEDNKPKHYYNIEYIESDDGINWHRQGQNIPIDFKDEYEYAFGIPRVIKDSDVYKMWFCSRDTKDISTYRMCYAESQDGINWNRKDDSVVGLYTSTSGWDSKMICYPYIFDHAGSRYMLYNGNAYGKSGFGLAVLEQD
jgi:predicted GH43/DUF377 family glycosyl hydrolase